MVTLPNVVRSPDVPAVFRANLVRVIDGCSAEFLFDLRFGVFQKVKGQLFGLNFPESPDKAKAAKLGLEDLLLRTTFKDADKPYHVIKSHRMKHGAWWLFEIQGMQDGRTLNVNAEMVKRGFLTSSLPDLA